jgi:hypothetical protein
MLDRDILIGWAIIIGLWPAAMGFVLAVAWLVSEVMR